MVDLALLVIDPRRALMAEEFQPIDVLVFAAELAAQPDQLDAIKPSASGKTPSSRQCMKLAAATQTTVLKITTMKQQQSCALRTRP